MARQWLVSAAAIAALAAAPVLADEKAPEAPKPPVAPVTMAQSAPEAAKPPVAPVKVAQGTPAEPMIREEKDPEPPPRFTYGGSADFYYSYNFNDPEVPFNGLAAYDYINQDGINIGLIDLWADVKPDPIGFRLDLAFGLGGRVTNFAERLISRDDIWDHVQQAYLRYNINRKGTTYLDVGRWVTPAGAEVIESRDNWLFSRGVLFAWALPYTHTGVRVYHYLNETDYVMAHVNQGWDTVSSSDAGPGFGVTYSKALSPKLTLVSNYIGGEEPNPEGVGFRHLVDLVALYNPGGKTSYILNLDYATQGGDSWYGASATMKYAPDEKQYWALRGEFLADQSGQRFGTGRGTTAYTLTAGYTRIFNKHFQMRAEYRHDFSSGADLFPTEGFGTKNDQGRFILAGILGF